MAGKSSQTVWMLLMLVCMVTLVRPGLASRAPQVTLAPRGNGSEKEDLECWYALAGVEGCVTMIQEALMLASIDLIEAACCVAINKMDDRCWALMFSCEPVYWEFLKSCSTETLVLAPAPAAQ
ncbi:hypothetical protein PVL29_014441 [Vitis rotundifolia]|uniref:Prolamin-like domain-containing protein n=1 Tax=Vitis rotundifolia TaxID=103349 RepID=A0AA39DLZ2_VITRO|nr:hypothetical protein PVL29_014441 [Vitis rotundifolia]